MKPMAYSRNKYSGELYKFVSNIIGDSSELKYYFVGNILITAGLDSSGRMTIRCDDPVQIGSLISNIKDSNGTPILDDTIWQTIALEPVMNAFNNIDSYRLRAVKFQGTL